MKKIFFLMLTLLIMSAASMNAQVRIGGTADPNPSAVLDLNATDAANTGTLGLALPRVNFSSLTAKLDGTNAPLNGMLVYNTNTGLGVGIYYWSGSSWIKIPNTDNNTTYTAGSGLNLSGTTFSIPTGVVTSDMIADKTIVAADLNQMDATNGQVLKYNGTAWAPAALSEVNLSCSGAIVYGGAYDGAALGTYITGLNGGFEANWSHSTFSIQGRDLCWAPGMDGNKSWEDARAACAAKTTDNRNWRLPNLKELQVLYEALGGIPGVTPTDYSQLNARGTGKAIWVGNLAAAIYWSSTEWDPTQAYRFGFNAGIRAQQDKDDIGSTLCVRSF
jgi:hypothetical protein